MQPQRLGRYLKLDSSGFVIPDVSAACVEGIWKAPIESAVSKLKSLGQATSIYIRGSIPRGLGIENVSDLDFMYCSETENPNLETELETQFKAEFPYVKGVELIRLDQKRLNLRLEPQTRPYFQMLLKTQSLFLDGLDMTKSIEPFKLDLNMTSHAFHIDSEFKKLSGWLDEDRKKNSEQTTRKWFYRRLVRAGAEICIDRLDRFTRDLYLCFEDFSGFYPQYKLQMKRALEGALNGATDPLAERDLVSLIVRERDRLTRFQ